MGNYHVRFLGEGARSNAASLPGVRNNPVSKTDPTGHCEVDPYDPYYDYECHQLALQISKAESQGNPENTQNLYDYYDAFTQDSLQTYYDEAVMPYLAVQQYTAQQAELVANGQIDDVQALQNILIYSLTMAGGDKDIALIYASSAFYRPEVSRFGGAQDYSYTYKTTARFGVSGFASRFVGDSSNTNQLQHFIGEAAVISHWGSSQVFGNLMVWYFDRNNTPASIADRELGYVAAWWVSQTGTVNLSELITILRSGEFPNEK